MLQSDAAVYRLYKTMQQIQDTTGVFDESSTIGKPLRGMTRLLKKFIPLSGIASKFGRDGDYSICVKPHLPQKYSTTHMGNCLEVFLFKPKEARVGTRMATSLPNCILDVTRKGISISVVKLYFQLCLVS